MTEQTFDHDFAPAPKARRSFALKGRGNRKEYWAALGVMFGVAVLLGALGFQTAGSSGGVVGLFFMIRRLHDFNRSGWWSLAITFGPVVPMLALIPFVQLEVLIPFVMLISLVWTAWLGSIPGDPHENRFGPPPGRPDLKEVFS